MTLLTRLVTLTIQLIGHIDSILTNITVKRSVNHNVSLLSDQEISPDILLDLPNKLHFQPSCLSSSTTLFEMGNSKVMVQYRYI